MSMKEILIQEPQLSYSISYASIVIVLLLAPLFLFLTNRKPLLNKMYICFSLSIAWWALFSIIALNIPDTDKAVIWCRIFMIAPILIPSFYTHFVLIFVKWESKYRNLVKANYIASIFFLLANTTPYFVSAAEYKFGTTLTFVKPGPLFIVHLAHFLFAIIITKMLLIRSLKRVDLDTHHKKQIALYLSAAIIGYIGGTPNYTIPYNMQIPYLNPYGNYAVAFYGILVFYIIFRYKFLDVNIIIKRTLLFTGVIASAILVFGTLTFVFNSWMSRLFGMSQELAMFLSIIVVALSSDPIYRFLQNKTDRFLFQKKYEYQNMLKETTRQMARITDLEDLLTLLTNFLVNRVRLDKAYIFLHNKSHDGFILKAEKGDSARVRSIMMDSGIYNCLRSMENPIWVDQNERSAQRGSVDNLYTQCVNELKCLDINIAIPSIGPDGIVAIFLLGKKRSGEPFNQIDLDTLDALAHDAAIALENARLYDDLKKSFNELKATKDQLVQSEKLAAVGQLAAGVAHEVNNPLAVIRGQAAIKLKQYKNLPKPVIEFMEEVVSQTDRAAMITKKLLRFSKAKRGEIEALDPAKLLDESLKYAQQQTPTNHVKIIRSYPSSPVTIQAHRQQIQEVFINLILNAYQAMPEGGDLTLQVQPNGRSVCISVQDTGSGISEDLQSKIFDPFFTTKKEGTGLGLFVSYKIMQAHSGNLEIESERQRGTKFIASLPSLSSDMES